QALPAVLVQAHDANGRIAALEGEQAREGAIGRGIVDVDVLARVRMSAHGAPQPLVQLCEGGFVAINRDYDADCGLHINILPDYPRGAKVARRVRSDAGSRQTAAPRRTAVIPPGVRRAA